MSTTPSYRFAERVMHAMAALSYVYLLLTGLALWTPALYWIAIVLGGGFLTAAAHPWVGVFFSAIVAWMFVTWSGQMRITDADREWRKALGRYVRNEDHRMPSTGRFNYGQKMLFWTMAGGALALLVSGLVLWVPQSIPREIRVIREAAVLVHAIGALITIGAFIVHVYMGVAVVPGGLNAIIHGGAAEPHRKIGRSEA
jgi:formate dehydrogenase subunit gamma